MKNVKKKIILLILILIFGAGYLYNNLNNPYNTLLTNNYNDLYIKLSNKINHLPETDRNILKRFIDRNIEKNSYPIITFKEAIKLENDFENSNEGISYFEKQDENKTKKEIFDTINQSLFLTYIDNIIDNNNNIIINYAIKNKAKVNIIKISGIGDFLINNEHYIVKIDISQDIKLNATSIISVKYDPTEYAFLTDLSKNKNISFKFNAKYIKFSDRKEILFNNSIN